VRETVRKLPASVYRCKGIVHTAEAPEQRIVLQAVGRRSSPTPLGPWGDRRPATDIVLIGVEGSLDRPAPQEAFDACRTGAGAELD
jgi:G3E family GTPase